MKHTPLLLGAEDGMFALAIGDIQTALTLGAVLLVFGAVVESPVWTKLAAGLERVGVPSILVEMPGHGLNGNATIDAREVVARARRALTEAGLEKVVVITESAGMEPAAAAASTDSDIVELIVAGLPLPDVATKLARNVGALDYMRRGVRLSAIKSLADAERRKRYLELASAKLAWSIQGRANRRKSPETPDVLSDPAVPELAAALSAGTRALVVCGQTDRCHKRSRELADAFASRPSSEGAGLLEVDASFPGRLVGFGSLQAQDWFVSRALTEVGRLVGAPSPSSVR